MKKLLIVLTILTIASPAIAGWNLNFWGSNDKQHKNRGHNKTVPIEQPINVPEPATILLLSTGLVFLVGWKRK